MYFIFSFFAERAIARHEVREIEQRHIQEAAKEALVAEDDLVVIYNRVPKTASTSFTNIAYDLCNKNHYHVLHINTTKNNPVMSLQDQVSCACSLLVPFEQHIIMFPFTEMHQTASKRHKAFP